MGPKLGKLCERPLIYPWVSPLILLYHTRAIFPIYLKKGKIRRHYTTLGQFFCERKNEKTNRRSRKHYHHQECVEEKNQRLDWTDQRLRKCCPTKWSRACHQRDRPDELMTKSMSSAPRKPKESRKARLAEDLIIRVSTNELTPHWGKIFSKLKNCEEKPVRDLSSQFRPNQEVCA